MAYNKDQWIASFEGQLSILRPHLTNRVLATMSLQAWHRFGRDDQDPVHVARELSKLLDSQAPVAAPAPVPAPVPAAVPAPVPVAAAARKRRA